MRVIAITGASAGIGRATALRMAREGAAIAICARRADRLDSVAAEIVAAGGQALAMTADGTRGVPYMGAYSATKFAQVGLAECLRSELVGTGIHVSVVYPVSTETEFFDVMSAETGSKVTRAAGPTQSAGHVADAI